MEHQNEKESVSNITKTITAFVVVVVLVVSALTINSVQSRASLEAQTGFFSKIFNSISNVFKFKKDDEKGKTFATGGAEDGNILSFSSDDSLVFNFDDLGSAQARVMSLSSDGIAYVPENNHYVESIENSYIVRFKSEPIATKTREILQNEGYDILPGKDSQQDLQFMVGSARDQIDAHQDKISLEQQKVLERVNARFGVPVKNQNGFLEYNHNNKTIKIRQLKSAINAVTISNVSELELRQITKNIDDIVSIEQAKLVSADLVQTPDIINSIDLQEYLGANGVPLTGEGTVVAIVDTGVDYMHQDFGSCSFLEQGNCKVIGGYDFINDDSNPMDDHGHGTHVAATAAGNGFWTDDQGGVQPLKGIAPDAKILAFKVLSAAGSGSSIAVIAGIEACVDPNGDGLIDDRATVCSLSLGSPSGDPMDSQSLASDAAVDAGVIMTIAAGNNGPGYNTIGSPGTSRKAITVGASCKPEDIGSNPKCPNTVATFSSRGPVVFTDENNQQQTIQKPDIVSPGVNICAAQWGDWLDQSACLGDGKHIAINGTSMATPTVAGLMALLAQAHPDKTAEELKEVLLLTATDLDLPVEIQGQGLVNGLSALESLGIPNTILQIEGLPFWVNDSSSAQISSFSQTLQLRNITNQTLNLTAERVGESSGVSLEFPTSFVINQNEQIDFPVSVTVDHTVALSGSHKETILISNGVEDVKIILTRDTPRHLVTDSQRLDFGLFHESISSYTHNVNLELTNRMSEQDIVYDVVFDEGDIASSFQDNIEYTSSVDQVVLGPNETQTISINLSAIASSSNPLTNNKYTSSLKLVSETETIVIPLSFFRGYGFTFNYEAGVVPELIVLEGSSWEFGYYPNPNLDFMTLFATQPGPYDAAAVYADSEGDKKIQSVVFETNIDLSSSTEILNYDISKNLVEHEIDNTFFGNACYWQWMDREGDFDFSFMGGGEFLFQYNTLPENTSFSLICGDLKPSTKRAVISQIYLTDNLNQDFVLNNETADHSTRYIYGFNNFENHTNFSLGLAICNFRRYHFQGPVRGNYNACAFWQNENGQTLDLSEGESAALEVYSLHTETPETSLYPDFPGFRLYTLNRDATSERHRAHMVFSAEMFATSEKLFAWANPSSGIFSTSTSSHDFYNKHKIDVVNDNFFTVGVGPVADVFTSVAYKDDFVGNFYNYFSNQTSPYLYADGSTEHSMLLPVYQVNSFFNFLVDTNPFTAQLLSNGPGLKAQIFPDAFGNFSSYTPPLFGNYIVNVVRSSLYNGSEDTSYVSNFVFNLDQNSTVDSMIPVIENIQLVGDGLLQNVFDPSISNELRLRVNPGYGIQYHGLQADQYGAYIVDLFDDQLSLVKLYVGDSENDLIEVPVFESEGYVSASLDAVPTNGAFKYFTIELIDSYGNSHDYSFRVEVGEALQESELADPDLLSCVENQPTVTWDPGEIILQEGGPVVAVDFILQNNNTIACEPVNSFGINFDGDAYVPPTQAQRVRGTANPSAGETGVFNTVDFLLSFDTVNSGQSTTKTAWFKADAGLYDYIYNIDIEVTGLPQGFEPLIFTLPIDIESDIVHPANCGIEDSSVIFSSFDNTHPEGNTTVHNVTVEVTNNDNPLCGPSSFLLEASDTQSWFATHKNSGIWDANKNYKAYFINLEPGQTMSDVVYYKSFSQNPGSVDVAFNLSGVNESFVTHNNVQENISVYYGDVEEEVPAYCVADFNGDGTVNTGDQVMFNANFGSSNPQFDLNGNGVVNTADLLLFLEYYNNAGCPATEPIDPVDDPYIDASQDPEISVTYELETSNQGSSTIYDYEIIITNTSNQAKSNVVISNFVPESQMPFAEFTAATIPNVSVNLDTGQLSIPSIAGGQSVSVFVTVTQPN